MLPMNIQYNIQNDLYTYLKTSIFIMLKTKIVNIIQNYKVKKKTILPYMYIK